MFYFRYYYFALNRGYGYSAVGKGDLPAIGSGQPSGAGGQPSGAGSQAGGKPAGPVVPSND